MSGRIINSQVVGIDLGTTFTEATFWDDVGTPKPIPDLEGHLKTPSVVYVSKGAKEILVGVPALSMLFLEPERTFIEFKRDVGTDKIYLSENGIDIVPSSCQGFSLKNIRISSTKFFGDKRAASKAVITVPAYFGEKERQSVMKSAELAGIEVIMLINEPTAAALAFGISEKQGENLICVPDFGGGTFDVSVIQCSGGKIDVIGSSGDKYLGGKDVDKKITDMVQEKFMAEHNIEVSSVTCAPEWYGIWEEVIRQKHMLSSKNEVKIIARAMGKQVVLELSRDQLNKAVSPLMERIKAITFQLLKDISVSEKDITGVLPIGGSSRLSAFRDCLKEMFGEQKIIGGRVSPDMAVAEGAVIKAIKEITSKGNSLVNENLQAIPAPSIEVSDVMPHSLGVAVQDRVTDAKFCSVILEKNTLIPCRVSKTYGSVANDQKEFSIIVVQGEDNQPIDDCLTVGKKQLTLPNRGIDQKSIEITIGYDKSGMVDVCVHDLISNKVENIAIDFYQKK